VLVSGRALTWTPRRLPWEPCREGAGLLCRARGAALSAFGCLPATLGDRLAADTAGLGGASRSLRSLLCAWRVRLSAWLKSPLCAARLACRCTDAALSRTPDAAASRLTHWASSTCARRKTGLAMASRGAHTQARGEEGARGGGGARAAGGRCLAVHLLGELHLCKEKGDGVQGSGATRVDKGSGMRAVGRAPPMCEGLRVTWGEPGLGMTFGELGRGDGRGLQPRA
jgi:hypothetical protein